VLIFYFIQFSITLAPKQKNVKKTKEKIFSFFNDAAVDAADRSPDLTSGD
jgi:hypothetical protein